ncbi:cobalt-precorrin-6A synthase [Ruminiclostridium hungatei]|uniref:Cobalt-precorrin-5B C(1)-methyltransferase n=1 Tax=Ruminiclostridium hungatei TaxID=48256 RepID=A0A1V4SR32_RUMHU|nr:cobalt-precorrin-5B (C(1))-methyltransferase CbiD [Ruminiclostridium hungatei]OPX45741.1 cobalt-precorrin-6A synthase [Ruminiclostridium hungatei]
MNSYILKDGRKLKCGYTTGSCAAGAAKACAEMLLSGSPVAEVAVNTPSGSSLSLQVEAVVLQQEWVSCAVTKDAGDDPDITHGIRIFAKVQKTDGGIALEGGKGVGRVTRKGLACAVGEAAINPVPRKMICEALLETAQKYRYEGGFSVLISAENGEEIGRKTFNPRLGITGGISILGTSGIVEPMSEKALIDTIHLEIDSRVEEAAGTQVLLVTPGNYGRDFTIRQLGLDTEKGIKCSNFIGETIDYAVYRNISNILLIGHAGKLCKIAGGIMNTHSRTADCRCEIFAAHAALSGASAELAGNIMEAATTEEIDGLLKEAGLAEKVYGSLMSKLEYHLNLRASGKSRVEAIMFTGREACCQTPGAARLVQMLREAEMPPA